MRFLLIFVFIFACLLPSSVSGQCFIQSAGNLGELSHGTGIISLDLKLHSEVRSLENFFAVKAEFYVYNDGLKPNAYAMKTYLPLFDGRVAFGKNYLNFLQNKRSVGDLGIIATLAHEYAHILQFKYNCQLPVKLRELHADYMAGYYLKKMGHTNWNALMSFMHHFGEIGDYLKWSTDHHGSPHERRAAFLNGFQNAPTYAASQIYLLGLSYVKDKNQSLRTCPTCDGLGTNVKGNLTCPKCWGTGSISY